MRYKILDPTIVNTGYQVTYPTLLFASEFLSVTFLSIELMPLGYEV